jgi:beta-phosphoglucomutase-like phosphatase (HAD superfamily)
MESAFEVIVASEEVGRGKPAPDVYVEALRRLGVAPSHAVGVEDSTNGLLALAAAGMAAIAIPSRTFPPDREALAGANEVLGSIEQLDVAVVERATEGK